MALSSHVDQYSQIAKHRVSRTVMSGHSAAKILSHLACRFFSSMTALCVFATLQAGTCLTISGSEISDEDVDAIA